MRGLHSCLISIRFTKDLWKLGSTNASYVTVNNGSWNNPATWSGGVVPSAGSVVIVRHAVTVQSNTVCYSLRMEGPNANVTVASGVQFTVLHQLPHFEIPEYAPQMPQIVSADVSRLLHA